MLVQHKSALLFVLRGDAPAPTGPVAMLTVIWPADSPVGCPVGRWWRLENGEIEAWYTRPELELAVAVEIVRRPAGTKGFKVLPRRGLVERSFGWFGRYRRLSKDFEHQPRSYTS